MPIRKLLLVVPLALLAGAAARAEGIEIAVRHGEDGPKIDGTGLIVRLGPVWSRNWGDWQFVLRPELELNRFRYNGSAAISGPSSLTEAAASAMWRFHRGGGRFGPYAEVGLGGAALSRTHLANKEFSTDFQFTERVGLGVEFPGRWFVGWQYSHYSNASIKTPNDGIDFQQIIIGVTF